VGDGTNPLVGVTVGICVLVADGPPTELGVFVAVDFCVEVGCAVEVGDCLEVGCVVKVGCAVCVGCAVGVGATA
jgi:hypothetical protein